MLFNQFAALISVPVQDGIFELLSFPGLRQVFSPTTPSWVNDYLTDSEEEKIRSANDKYQMECSVLSYVLAVERDNRFSKPYEAIRFSLFAALFGKRSHHTRLGKHRFHGGNTV